MAKILVIEDDEQFREMLAQINLISIQQR